MHLVDSSAMSRSFLLFPLSYHDWGKIPYWGIKTSTSGGLGGFGILTKFVSWNRLTFGEQASLVSTCQVPDALWWVTSREGIRLYRKFCTRSTDDHSVTKSRSNCLTTTMSFQRYFVPGSHVILSFLNF